MKELTFFILARNFLSRKDWKHLAKSRWVVQYLGMARSILRWLDLFCDWVANQLYYQGENYL